MEIANYIKSKTIVGNKIQLNRNFHMIVIDNPISIYNRYISTKDYAPLSLAFAFISNITCDNSLVHIDAAFHFSYKIQSYAGIALDNGLFKLKLEKNEWYSYSLMEKSLSYYSSYKRIMDDFYE